MPTLNDIVNISTVTPSSPLQAGDFKTACIFTSDTPDDPSFDFYRQYTGEQLVSVGEDFGTSSNTYLAFQSLTQYDDKPSKVLICARESASAVTKTITFDKDLTANCRINGTVNGVAIAEVIFDTDQETTMDNFSVALEDVIGIASATPSSTPFRVMTVVGTVEFPLEISFTVTGISNPPIVTIATTTAGRTITDDILDMQDRDSNWYVGLIVQKGDGIITGASRTLQALGKDFIFASSSSDIANKTAGNILLKLQGQSNKGLNLWSAVDTEFADFSFVGALYSTDPYTTSAIYKTLLGVTPSSYNPDDDSYLSTTQEANILSSGGNVYRTIAGASNTWKGRRIDGTRWSDRRDIDYLKNAVQIDVYSYFRSKTKVLFTNPFLQTIGSIIKSRALKAEENDLGGLFVKGSVRVVVPAREDFSANDIANGIASGFKLYGTLAGTLDQIEIDFIFSY